MQQGGYDFYSMKFMLQIMAFVYLVNSKTKQQYHTVQLVAMAIITVSLIMLTQLIMPRAQQNIYFGMIQEQKILIPMYLKN